MSKPNSPQDAPSPQDTLSSQDTKSSYDLILVLGDQLSPHLASLKAGDPAKDIVLMAEVMEEATYVPHHTKKLAFIFTTMRHFHTSLHQRGWTVDYRCLDDPANQGSLVVELERAVEQYKPFRFAVTRADAEAALDHFIKSSLPSFGSYQDAMLQDQCFLYHSVLSPYINTGLLDPLHVCRRAEQAYASGHAPLNAVSPISTPAQPANNKARPTTRQPKLIHQQAATNH